MDDKPVEGSVWAEGHKGGSSMVDGTAQEALDPFEMRFDPATIKHLGLQMYSSLPLVVGELVANSWDAGASRVWVRLPEGPATPTDEIIVQDDGIGMSAEEIQDKYLLVGRDRRAIEGADEVSVNGKVRKMMGRKGIGKFSGFGVASEIEVESVFAGVSSRFKMDYEELVQTASGGSIRFPRLAASGLVETGTRVTLRAMRKYHTSGYPKRQLRRRLARAFSVIGADHDFQVIVNEEAITPDERDLTRLLDVGSDGRPFLWDVDEEIAPGSGWRVTGWIGTLAPRKAGGGADQDEEYLGVQRGVVVMARGKMVQTPFFFEAKGSQPYAFGYLVGELNAEFVDTADEDGIATSRTSLVWDTERNQRFLEWGQSRLWRIASDWASRRKQKLTADVEASQPYVRFRRQTSGLEERRNFKTVDRIVRRIVEQKPDSSAEDLEDTIQLAIDFVEFDAFHEIAEELASSGRDDIAGLMRLFREWEVVEAKEMMRVTDGRIRTIERLEELIFTDALEVPDVHRFLKTFPWVIDPRWTLVDDEVRYSDILRSEFPDSDMPEVDRRIDFLCVADGETLHVVEIKRPGHRATLADLMQIEQYVSFMRDYVSRTSDEGFRRRRVVGHLLVGDRVDSMYVREKVKNLAEADIYVRRYADLLGQVRALHGDFLTKYELLRERARRAEIAQGTPAEVS